MGHGSNTRTAATNWCNEKEQKNNINNFKAFEKNSRIESGYVGLKDLLIFYRCHRERQHDAKLLPCGDTEVSLSSVFASNSHPIRSMGVQYELCKGTKGSVGNLNEKQKPSFRIGGRKEGRSG
ncbi:mannosyl-oligosaccharide 1,2-alpha-mannosidase MNS2-like [Arachis hypogaea]|uniref:mannosyl-oligosaccharide 1,2-alpha-mannosidase MNS2-like n=1 Tax=Arachis hypogaea TaxID=3818 RepID=UPI003B222BC0